ncbi:unnamed protein product [Trichogramma brassicae]|uniref:Uncharacterized protein n=1 Tax=Trichogramma brassicae TaxID=86971 RepID=A0A6H5IR62_9HYME|nr:unnamed protein product [Trichogramma brassicae]
MSTCGDHEESRGSVPENSSLRALKSARENAVDRSFLLKLYRLIYNWKGQLPNLRDIFPAKEIEWLIRYDVKYGCEDQFPLIDFAIRTGYKDEAAAAAGTEPNPWRATPVHLAVRRLSWTSDGNRAIHRLFKIYDNFTVNYIDHVSGYTHFHAACLACCDEAVGKFLELGQDPNCHQSGVELPLNLALQAGVAGLTPCWPTVELLLRGGADPNLINEDGLNTLQFLVELRDCTGDFAETFFNMLDDVQRPIDVDAPNGRGEIPLHRTLFSRDVGLTEALLRRGADPHRANEAGVTALHLLSRADLYSHYFKALSRFSSDKYQPLKVDIVDNGGSTPLQDAIFWGNKCVIQALLRNGADPYLANADGSTPLHVVCGKGSDEEEDLVERFLETVVEVHGSLRHDVLNRDGWTALQWAVASLKPDAVESLLSRGADLSGFVFPPATLFHERIEKRPLEFVGNLQLKLATGALRVMDCLEGGGYELDRSDVLTIMRLFSERGLFEKAGDLEEHWYADERHTTEAKRAMVKPSLSLDELIQLRPEEASKLLTDAECYRFAYDYICNFDKKPKRALGVHLSEKMSRGFFRSWALISFMELTRYRLPIEMCEIIVDNEFTNEDLYHICLAAAGQSINEGDSDSVRNNDRDIAFIADVANFSCHSNK